MAKIEITDIDLGDLAHFHYERGKGAKYFVRPKIMHLPSQVGILQGPSFYDGVYNVVPVSALHNRYLEAIRRDEEGKIVSVAREGWDDILGITVVWRGVIAIAYANPTTVLDENGRYVGLEDLFNFIKKKPKKEDR